MKSHSDSPAKFTRHLQMMPWVGIVDYANSGTAATFIDAFENTATRLGMLREGYRLRLRDIREVQELIQHPDKLKKVTDWPIENSRIAGYWVFLWPDLDTEPIRRAISYFAQHYHSEFRSALTWLCMPDKRRDLAQRSASFLSKKSEGVHWTTKAHKTGNSNKLTDFFRTELECDSLVSPICRYLMERILGQSRDDSSGHEAIPIAMCQREECGNFMISERQGRKRFCSDRCRALAFQHSRDDWNEYMKKYRKTIKRNASRKRK